MGSRRRVAVCLHNWGGFVALSNGIARFLQEQDRWTVFVGKPGEQDLETTLRGWKGDGLICSLASQEVADHVSRFKIPVVNVAGLLPSPGVPAVLGDDLAIGRMAARFFRERGFRNFAGITLSRTLFAERRAEGFEAEAKNCGGAVQPAFDGLPLHPLPWVVQLEHVMRWLEPMPKPLAVFAVNDPLAHLVIEASQLGGLRVPEDVAVMGVGNDLTYCELSNPPCSSVRIGMQKRGYEAARLLDRLIDGERPPAAPVRIAPEGVAARKSTDVFAVENPGVQAALRFIASHPGMHLSVDDVVRNAHMSRRNLERKFQEAVGRTVYDEIRRRRLDSAKALLSGSARSITEVALESGFLSSSDLSNAFRRHVGMTPGEYRNRHRAQ